MIRVLFIARYWDALQHRKVTLMAQDPDLVMRAVYPQRWQSELMKGGRVTPAATAEAVAVSLLPMVGAPTDPHRTFYRTLTFGMHRFHPHIIHAEEEPDSLAALQIAAARRLAAPQARLILHTWQNITRPLNRPARWVLRRTLSAADAIFAANREAASLLRAMGYRRPAPVIPAQGVNTERFTPCPDRQPTAAGRFVVGYIGRLVPEKGVDTLIEAVAALSRRHPNLALRIVGAGVHEETLRTTGAAHGVTERVTFLPPVPPDRVPEVLCGLDVLVLPSRTTSQWKEQLGRVLLEAMASRVAVIGSDSGAIPEVIEDGGLIVPEGDTKALADSIERIMRHPELAAQLSDRGYRRAVDFYSQHQLAAATVAFYQELLT